MPETPKGLHERIHPRQGANSWQVHVFNRHVRRYEHFTVRGDKPAAKRATARRIGEIDKGSLPPPPGAGEVTIREITNERLDRKRAQREAKTIHQYE